MERRKFNLKKKKYIIAIISLVFITFFSQKNYAKYIMGDKLEMNVYIDKTPPIIEVVTNGEKESFPTSNLENVIKRTSDVIISTTDNIAIKENEYYYNPSNKDFNGISSNKFENNKQLIDDGYYKIIATDTSGNKTEIVILLDKSAPEVYVQYFKKGDARSVLRNATPEKQVAAIRKNLNLQEVVNTDNTVENSIIENSVSENITNENVLNEEIIENRISDETENIEEITQSIEEIIDENTKEITNQVETIKDEIISNEPITEDVKPMLQSESDIMVMSARSGEIFVGNEAEFRNGLAMQASVIRIRDSINFSSPIVVNYPLTIVREGESNSIRYGNGGSFITVQAGGSLVLDGVVVDTNSSGNGGMVAINIENGGNVTFVNSSIVDRTDWVILES